MAALGLIAGGPSLNRTGHSSDEEAIRSGTVLRFTLLRFTLLRLARTAQALSRASGGKSCAHFAACHAAHRALERRLRRWGATMRLRAISVLMLAAAIIWA